MTANRTISGRLLCASSTSTREMPARPAHESCASPLLASVGPILQPCPVAAIDAHRTGTADPFSAGAAEGQRRVYLVLDVYECVQDHRAALVEIERANIESWVATLIRVPAIDLESLDAPACRCRSYLAQLRPCLGRKSKCHHAPSLSCHRSCSCRACPCNRVPRSNAIKSSIR